MIGVYAPNGRMGKAVIESLSQKNLAFIENDKKKSSKLS